ncbi:MAG: hypothetical protein QM754_12745 [Tepidisphaeraceae bacterium]
MNKWVASAVSSAVASVVLFANPLFAAGPTTLPSPLLDAMRSGDWQAVPQRLKLQSASAGRCRAGPGQAGGLD